MNSLSISKIFNYFIGLFFVALFVYGLITAILAALLGGANEHLSLR